MTERTTQQDALESMERRYHASLEAWTAEGQEIERALSDLHAEVYRACAQILLSHKADTWALVTAGGA